MVAVFPDFINRLVVRFRRPPPCPSVVAIPDDPCPLIHPAAPLPAWVADDPVVQKYRTLIGSLPWDQFPERPTDHPWPGPTPHPRVSFAAAYLVKLQEDKRYMSDLRTYLIEHPALVYWLGFARVPDPTAPHGFQIAASVPTRRQLGTVLRTLPNSALQFLLSASIQVLTETLTPEEQATFGDTIAGDTQALLAWVKENNPKQYIKEGRLDKTRQPAGDPDCTLGVKHRRNTGVPDDAADHPAPSTDAKPASKLQVGVDIFWGYASGIVVTRLPDETEVVLAERTRPFNESDPSHFRPLMAQVEERLGRQPRFGTWDAAFDAHYVYEYFDQAGGFAAVPFNGGGKRAKRTFAPDGTPLCAAGLAMHLNCVYQDRTSGLEPYPRAKYDCPLLRPTVTGESCPCGDAHFAKGGCSTTIANTRGARIRHELDRESDTYKKMYALRTMVERINSQAEALDILRPKLRRGQAIINRNTLTYVLINLRAHARRCAAATEGRTTPI